MSIYTSNNKTDEIDDIDDYEVKIYDYEEDDYVLFNSHGINLNLLNTTINTNTNINSLDSRYKFLTGENHHSLKDNFYYCYACNKKLLICEQEYTNFFIDNIDKRKQKSNIIMLYRLYPPCITYITPIYVQKFNEITKNINTLLTFYGSSEWILLYEIYFNQPNLDHSVYMQCDLCEYEFCPKHQNIAPFKYYKCEKCKRNISLCNWCKNIYMNNTYCYVCMED